MSNYPKITAIRVYTKFIEVAEKSGDLELVEKLRKALKERIRSKKREEV